ncbi:hypothetical protein BTZ53_10825 [Vibrio parahaemolyticus]|uniref:hypothetical protein n=1 Tax=Vibrio parahaemolyticus TaxID=670 RepID=UPI000A3C18E5|nr:hypothetical protein [Vibrio parahaemolyticus]OUJ46303.1 hypothetical protein BTZ53_10825 [Vibrio parahaemolyticus]
MTIVTVEVNGDKRLLTKDVYDWLFVSFNWCRKEAIPIRVAVNVFDDAKKVNVNLYAGQWEESRQIKANNPRIPNEEEAKIITHWRDIGCHLPPVDSVKINKFLSYFMISS